MDKKTPPEAAEPITLNFIRDRAADEDGFGSHTRLATAIASVITTHTDLKVIGLLGPWGSGKSTVLNFVEEQLGDEESIEPYCFSYDAWLHQKDPPRRSFLETLVHYLKEKGLASKEVRTDWKARLDKLNGRVEEWEKNVTPSLTTSGRLLLWSIFFLPLGAQFVGHDWFNKAFVPTAPFFERWAFPAGVTLLALPILLAIGIYLYWRPRMWPSWEFWTTHRGKHKDDSILSLVMNKEVEKTQHRITRTPEPSAIEFQDTFRAIMDSVSGPKRRFIFIIDNLDRLPEADAVAMWGTIRSFFLGAQETQYVRKVTNEPTVILPIDEDAVRRIYEISHDRDAGALAKSFMDKTFDLTFRVTRPVLSDWATYLENQMKSVFGEQLSPQWTYQVGTIYEHYSSEVIDPDLQQRGLSITPRAINTLINSIATLWLQWRAEQIEFASIAYYAIYRERIDDNIQLAVSSPSARINDIDPDWQQSIAALHYGVAPHIAVQILIEQPLRTAISDLNKTEFKRLQTVRGFERVLKRVFDQMASGDANDLTFVLNAAVLLEDAKLPGELWSAGAWLNLVRALPKTGNWNQLPPIASKAIASLTAHALSASEIVTAVTEKLSAIDPARITDAKFAKIFAEVSKSISDAAAANETDSPEITVPGDANTFLTIIQIPKNDSALLRTFQTTASGADIVAQLVGDISDQGRAMNVEARFRAIISRGSELPWGPLVTTAGQLVQTQNINHPGISAALLCLGLLRETDTGAAAQIKQSIDSGQLSARLNEAHNANQVTIEARALALFILTMPNTPAPAGVAWEKAIADRPNLAPEVDKALTQFDTPDNVDKLVQIANSHHDCLPLIKTIITGRVQRGKLGRLHLERIIENLPQYLSCIDATLHEAFITKVSGYRTFWDKLENAPVDANTTTILHALVGSDGEIKEKACTVGKIKLERIDSATWKAAIEENEEPLQIALEIMNAEPTGPISRSLFDALRELIPDVLTNPDAGFRRRWFGATTLVSDSGRRTAYKDIRDRLNAGANVKALPGIFAAAGPNFFEEARFIDEPDKFVRSIVIPLCTQLDGPQWLRSTMDQLKPLVAGSSADTKNVLAERIAEQLRTGGDSVPVELKELPALWSLPEPPRETPPEDGESETT